MSVDDHSDEDYNNEIIIVNNDNADEYYSRFHLTVNPIIIVPLHLQQDLLFKISTCAFKSKHKEFVLKSLVGWSLEFSETDASHSRLKCPVLQHSPSRCSQTLNDDQDELRKQLEKRRRDNAGK